MAWFDTHCHDVTDDDIHAARREGVTRLVTVGTDGDQSRAAVHLAQSNQDVWATVGVHPHEARHGVEGIEGLLGEEKVVAVGECGLDYHYDHSPRPAQKEVFAAQVALAHQRGLALVVHTRDAWDDTFSVLAAEGVPERTVFHCFTGGPDEARRALDVGGHLSFSGIATFPGAAVAAARGDDVAVVEEASWQGAHRAFALPPRPRPPRVTAQFPVP